MDCQDLVSIITSTYNNEKYISATIEAIQSQTYPNWELLVTDDCSDDNSYGVVQSYIEKDPRIKLFKLNKNSGAGIARNNSIQHAKGRFIAFCDADDRWYPNKLEKQIGFMKNTGAHLSYSSYDVCDENNNIIGFVSCLKNLTYPKILRDNGIGCLTAIYDAEQIGKHYMPAIRKRQDWCLWIEIIKNYGAALGLKESLAIYRHRDDSISSNKFELLKYNFDVYNKVLKHNRFVSSILLYGYFMPYYVYKKFKQKINYKRNKD